MKRLVSLLLVLMVLVGILALPVCAQSAPQTSTVKVYGEEASGATDFETVKVYGEQEQSFWGWLQNLWQQFISLFGF